MLDQQTGQLRTDLQVCSRWRGAQLEKTTQLLVLAAGRTGSVLLCPQLRCCHACAWMRVYTTTCAWCAAVCLLDGEISTVHTPLLRT
jgi:hypothetical protein